MITKLKAVASRALKHSPTVYDCFLLIKPLLGGSGKTYGLLRACEDYLGRPASFLQLGANDGLWYDPIRPFARWRKWGGVMVEPQPGIFRMLERNYRMIKGRLTLLNVAVGLPGQANLRLFAVSEAYLAPLPLERQLHFLRKSSLDAEAVAKFLPPAARGEVVECVVPAMTVEQMWSSSGTGDYPDVLAMDLEGFDAEVILSIDLARFRPLLILFESIHLDSDRRLQTTQALTDAGYDLHSFDNDSVAIRRGTFSFDPK